MYRDKFFPHLRQVFLATHSHLFLDRTVLSNNFIVSRHGLKVSVQPVTSPSAMHHLQFNLLGNDLEALSLPSAIVVVEGESDQIFLTRIFQVYLPDKRVSVVRAGGDGEIYHKVNVLREALGDIVTGPYRDRLFAVLDDRNSTNKARLVNQGLHTEHIQTWSKNGIEYFYPDRRMTEVFACSEAELALINRESDPIEFNSIRRTKKSLSQEIAQKLTTGDQLHAELESFVAKIRQVTS